MNMNINQNLYSHAFEAVNPPYVRLGVVFFIGLGFCILSFFAGVVLALFDKRAERITKRKTGNGERLEGIRCRLVDFIALTIFVTWFPYPPPPPPPLNIESPMYTIIFPVPYSGCSGKNLQHVSASMWFLSCVGSVWPLTPSPYHTTKQLLLSMVSNGPSPPPPYHFLNPCVYTGERISLRDIKDFPLRLWLIFLVCVAYYVTVFPFIGLAVIFLMEKYGYEAKEANIVNSLVSLKFIF